MSRRSTASELRARAKGALKGRWLTAVMAFLLVTVFGLMGGSVSFDFSSLMYDVDTETVEETEIIDETEIVEDVEFDETMEQEDAEWLREEFLLLSAALAAAIVVGLVIAAIVLLYSIFIAPPVRVGYYRFNLDLYSRSKGGKLDTMWFGFKQRYWKSVGTYLLQALVVFWKGFVWCGLAGILLGFGVAMGATLLGAIFVLFGLIALFWAIIKLALLALDYAMVGYLVADRADLSSRQILMASKQMMYGNRWRFVKLGLSFFGWGFLVLLTFGLASPFLGAYVNAAHAAFYRELPKPRV